MQLPKPTEGGDFSPAPAGTFTATCYRFIDLGTHISEYNGERKTRHEVLLSWELADEMMQDGRPFTINKRYTWSMHEKATLRLHLEAWRGRKFEQSDFEGENAFNTRKLLGVPCTLTVTQETKPDGKVVAKVSGVGKAMKGIQPPSLVNETIYIALNRDSFDAEAYGKLSDYFKELIAQSPEYKEIFAARRYADDPPPPSNYDGPVDDIPF